MLRFGEGLSSLTDPAALEEKTCFSEGALDSVGVQYGEWCRCVVHQRVGQRNSMCS